MRIHELIFVEALEMLSAYCSYLLSEHSCLIRLCTGTEGLVCWKAGPAWEARWLWQFMTVFPEWTQIYYFNTGDTTFLLIAIVSLPQFYCICFLTIYFFFFLPFTIFTIPISVNVFS